MADLGELVVRLRADATRFTSQFNTAQSQISKFGSGMKSVGSTLSKYVTLPTLALGVAAVKTTMDFDSGMSKVQAISGATGKELGMLRDKAKEMGAKTKFSATESAEAFKFMAQAGWKTSDMLNSIDGVMNLAAASGEDLGLVSDIVTDSMTGLGLSAKDSGKFADLLASASSNANTTVAMMGETFKYASTTAGALGYSAEDTALAIGLMASSGVKASMAGTSLRAGLTNLANPTKSMQAAMDKYGLSLRDSEGKMLSFRDIIGQLRTKFSGLEEDEKAAAIASIFGKNAMNGWLAIVDSSDEAFEQLSRATTDYEGTAKNMAETMQNNLGGQLTILKSTLEGLAIQFGEMLTPYVSRFVSKIQELATKFGTISDKGKMFIITTLGISAAIGPLFLAVGGLASAFTSVSSAIALVGATVIAVTAAVIGLGIAFVAVNANFGLVKQKFLEAPNWVKGLISALVLINPAAQSFLLLTAAVQGVKFAMSPAIETTKLFGSSVSEATQKAVGGYMNLANKAEQELLRLDISSTTITQATAQKMTQMYADMGEQIVTQMQENHAKELETITATMEQTKVLTAEERAKILEDTKAFHEQEQLSVQEKEDRIAEIMSNAAEQKRELTTKEKEEINQIHIEMKEQAVEVMSQNELEQKSILERMKNGATEQTAAMAANIVKNSKDARDKSVKEAEAQYDETVQNIIKMRDETGSISEEQATKLIAEAKKTRDETIKEVDDMHNTIVEGAKKKAKDHVNEVNWETGEVRSKWGAMVETVKTKTSSMWTNVKNAFSGMWEDTKTSLSGIWETIQTQFSNMVTTIGEKIEMAKLKVSIGYEAMKTSASNKVNGIVSSVRNGFENMASAISDKMSNAKTYVTNGISSISEKLSGLASDAYTWGSNLISSFGDGIAAGIGGLGSIAGKAVGAVGGLMGFHSPTKEGPGKDSDTWAPNLMKMYTQGIWDNIPELEIASEKVAELLNSNMSSPSNMIVNSQGFSSQNQNINVSVNIDGRKVAQATAPHMVNLMKLQGV